MPHRVKPLWKLCAEAAAAAEHQGDSQAAERHYIWSLAVARHQYGTTHEDVGEAHINLADFYLATRQYERSQDSYRQALDVYDRLFGRDNLVAAMLYRVLAEIELRRRHSVSARVLQARSQEIHHHREAS